MKDPTFRVGDKVRMSAAWLRDTGQVKGRAGLDVFTVSALDNDGRWVVTDQPCDTSYFSAAELSADPSLAFRRIAAANLVLVGKPDRTAL